MACFFCHKAASVFFGIKASRSKLAKHLGEGQCVDILLRETEPELVGQVVRVLWEELAEVEVEQPLGKPSHHLHNHRHRHNRHH